MTATPTAIQLLEAVRLVNGRLVPRPPDHLEVYIPEVEQPRLLPLLRERKHDLLMLLQHHDVCPECDGTCWWQTSAGDWRCGTCSPDPRARRMRGVTPQLLGDRSITTAPPAGDLPMPGSWARTPAGAVAELVLYRADGGEVLMRSISEPGCLAWFNPGKLAWEFDWAWGGKQ